MATLNFPSSPSTGDTYTFGGKTWIYTADGAWKLQSSGAINGFPIGNSSPSTGAFTTLTSSGNTTLGNIAGNLLPAANITYDLGSDTQRWRDLYLANTTIYLGNAQISANATALVMTNPAGGQTVFSGATPSLNVSTISATGNITAGNLIALGTVKGVTIDSTNADLAERYQSDAEYAPGTVVVFGGDREITQSKDYADARIAGVISTAPAYCMNTDFPGLAVALMGRVPCRVTGTIRKGDLLTSSQIPGVATNIEPSRYQPGCVIGKALENYDSTAEGVIEVVVGRL